MFCNNNDLDVALTGGGGFFQGITKTAFNYTYIVYFNYMSNGDGLEHVTSFRDLGVVVSPNIIALNLYKSLTRSTASKCQ